MVAAMAVALTGCNRGFPLATDKGIPTGTYKDPIGGGAYILNGNGTFSMIDIYKCKMVSDGKYDVRGDKLYFNFGDGKIDSAIGPTAALQSAMAGDIDESKSSFSVMGLPFTRTSTDTSMPCTPKADQTPTAQLAPDDRPLPDPTSEMPFRKSNQPLDFSQQGTDPSKAFAPNPNAAAPPPPAQTLPPLVVGPKPSGRGNASGLYAGDGSFVPGEYVDGRFVAGARGPNGLFIPGRFTSKGEFISDAAASGGPFLGSDR